jgi:hypothetical protein
MVLNAFSAKRLLRGMGVARRPDMGVRRYQDLVAWQLANELKLNVYELVDQSSARDDR